MSSYDPSSPYVVGMGWPALYAQESNLDTSSEVGYSFIAEASYTTVDRAALSMAGLPAGQATRKELLVNIFRAGQEAATGPIRTLSIPRQGGALGTNASYVSTAGAPTVANTLSDPSDGNYIRLLGPNAFVRVAFDTGDAAVAAALDGRRILDVSIQYVVSGPFTAFPNGLTFGIEKPSASLNWIMDQTLTGPELGTVATAIQRSRFGELNPWWTTANSPGVTEGGGLTRERRPYVYDAVAPMTGLTLWDPSAVNPVNLRISTSSDLAASDEFHIDYINLLITYCEESRVGAGGLDITAGVENPNADRPLSYTIALGSVTSFGSDASLTAGARYVVSVGQSQSGQMSVASPVPVPVTRLGSVEQYTGRRGVLIRKTIRPNATHTSEETDLLPPLGLFTGLLSTDTNRVDGTHVYYTQVVATGSQPWTAADQYQILADEVAADFVWVRFWARRSPETSAPLVVSNVDGSGNPLGPQAQISLEEFDALDELVDGWKRVTLPLSPAYTGTGSGVSRWAFTSTTDVSSPWQVAGAATDTYPAQEALSYAGTTGYAHIDDADDTAADLAVVLAQEMDEVTGFTVTPAVQPLSLVDEHCALPVECIPTGINYHELTWDAINTLVVGGWGWYEVQRQDTTMDADEWETIGLITDPAITGMSDYEARVGVATTYRIRMVHETGIEGPWSSEVTATISAPGVTGTHVDASVLIFTSNENPDGNVAHVMSWEGRPQEDFTFPEASQVDLQRMYQRDYRVAFRPLERDGVEFTRLLLVNALGVPSSTMDKGFTGLRDLAWDTIPYVCVRDELDNRWLATLLLPNANLRRIPAAGHLELAQMTIIEVTDTPAPVDGGDSPCEGLAAEGGNAAAEAVTDDAPDVETNTNVLGTLVVQDFGSRSSVDTWNNPVVGPAWSTENGVAANYDVTAGVATHNYTVVNLQLRSIIALGTTDYRQSVQVQFGTATAPGAPVRYSLVGRRVNASNLYHVQVELGSDNQVRMSVQKISAGASTTLVAAAVVAASTGANDWWEITLRQQTSHLIATVRNVTTGGATTTQTVTHTDTNIDAGTEGALYSSLVSGSTLTLPRNLSFRSYTAVSLMKAFDMRLEIRPTEDEWGLAFGYTDSGDTAHWLLQADQTNTSILVDGDGTFSHDVPSSDMGLVKNRRRWIRVTYDSNIGSGNAQAVFYASDDGSTWSTIDTQSATAVPISILVGELAAQVTAAGVTIISAELRNGINGTVIASPDFEAQPEGTTQFTDAQSNTWNVDGAGICAS